MSSDTQTNRNGIWYAISAYVAWGILPLYWHCIEQISPLQILSHRIFWSFLFVTLLITFTKQWPQVKIVFRSWKTILLILGCSVFISANWFIYIWAVNNGHVIETSLGYYINPFISIAFGMIVFRERLDKWEWIALSCAIIGVVVQTVEFGQIPWIALALALTFAVYGLSKKLIKVNSMISLTLETMMITPFAVGYLLFVEGNGQGAIEHAPIFVIFLLICSGVITALPLLWFANGAKRVSLTTMGFIQYLAPTISLILGIFFFHEQFTKVDLISFGFIWLALVIYTLSRINFIHFLGRDKHQLKLKETS
jgi:chloramphenicol-sensitive protein RarD